MEPSTPQTSPAVPIAIICGFALIAVAIFFTGGKDSTPPTVIDDQSGAEITVSEGSPRPIDETDYIRGNPNAPIMMVVYSDYDCPFCKRFHETMSKIIDEYGVNGKVAWVYRQFPLIELHPNSHKISEAALCVGDIGGNKAFWKFSDLVYESRNATEFTNVTKLEDFVEESSVSLAEHQACLASGRMTDVLKRDMSDGLNTGVEGTPYSILTVGSQQAVIDGAQPYEVVKGIIVNLISQLEGTYDANAEVSTDSGVVPVTE